MDGLVLTICGLALLLCFWSVCRLPDYYGISPLQSSLADLEYLETIKRYQALMFTSCAVPRSLIFPEENQDDF